jgi:hypothetical protein
MARYKKANRYEPLPDGQTAVLYLTKGKAALLDVADLRRVLRYNWVAVKPSTVWYGQAWVGGKAVYLHRFLLDASLVDHRNQDGLDCRRRNLRAATKSQNNHNRAPVSHSSRYRGVSLDVRTGRWRPHISCQGRLYFGPRFSDERDAAIWWNAKARELFGDRAWQNGVDA